MGLRGLNIPATLTDHHHQLSLIIQLGRCLGQLNRGKRAVQGGDCFGKPQLDTGKTHAGFLGVVGIIQADRPDLARTFDRRKQLHGGEWKIRGAVLFELRKPRPLASQCSNKPIMVAGASG